MSLYKELKDSLIQIVKNAGYEEENIALETSNRKDLYNKKVKSQYSAPSAGYCDFYFQKHPKPNKEQKP